MRQTVRIPFDVPYRDVLTREAVTSLVGQTPTVTVAGDWSRPLGRATVVGAEFTDSTLLLTLEYDEGTAARIAKVHPPPKGDYSLGSPGPAPGACGFIAKDAGPRDQETGVRPLRAIDLKEVGLSAASPPAVERVDRYHVSVDGSRPIRADADQAARLAAMTPEQRKRFRSIITGEDRRPAGGDW